MELNEFQGLALRTESQISGIKLNAGNLVSLLKVVIEVTEILDAVKKAVFYNKTAKLEGDLTARLHALATLIEALKWQNSGRGPVGAIMAEESIKNVDPRVFHGILGIITESGELASALLKSIENEGTPIDPVNIQEEMSDIAWYKAILHDSLNLDWGQGLENVINKLRIRYPDKYSDEAAANRDLDAERAALEVGVDTFDAVKVTSTGFLLPKEGVSDEEFAKQVYEINQQLDSIQHPKRKPKVKPLAENPITFEDLVSTRPLTPNTGEIFEWNAPAGTNRGNMVYDAYAGYVNVAQEFVTGKSFVNSDLDLEVGKLEDDRQIFYCHIPDSVTREQLDVIMEELKNRFLHTQTYTAAEE